MAYDNIKFAIEDGIATLTFNRPQALNAFNPGLIEDTRAAVAEVATNDAARVLILTGEGRAFSSGADLAEGFKAPEGSSVGDGVAHSMEVGFNPMAREIAALSKPVLSAVNGVTAGGGVGVALAADIVVAAKSAYFVQVFGPQLGLVPDVGCTWYYPRLVGRARARALALLGDRLYAEQAEEWGLIWKAVDDEQLMPATMEIAAKLASGPTKAFGRIKNILDASETNGFSAQLDLERDYQRELGDTEDFVEGVTAFLTKRPAQFKGK